MSIIMSTITLPISILRKIPMAQRVKKRYLNYRRSKYYGRLREMFGPEVSFITNDCFGGRIPQDLGYPYNSPTEGLYICYPEYIEFLKHLPEAIKAEVKIVERSRRADVNSYLSTLPDYVPVGVMTMADGVEIEIVFLHYHTAEEALEKWYRRCKRVNMEHLVVFGSDNDGCTEEDQREFLQLPFERKFFFSAHNYGIENGPNYAYVKEMRPLGHVEGYNRAHIMYKYLVNLFAK